MRASSVSRKITASAVFLSSFAGRPTKCEPTWSLWIEVRWRVLTKMLEQASDLKKLRPRLAHVDVNPSA
jgi:hypothetical protein